MRLLVSTYGSGGDVGPMVGPAVQVRVRALQARGAEMPMCALSACAEPLACVGLPLVSRCDVL